MVLITGQKYEFALKWQLKVVRSDWLYESIEKGFCLTFMVLITGQKYEFALKWQLKVVRSDWLYESIEKGFCQDETKYEVKTQSSDKQAQGGMKTSTPERRSLAGNRGQYLQQC